MSAEDPSSVSPNAPAPSPEPAASPAPSAPKLSPEGRSDRLRGMLIVFVTFLATLCLAWWAKWKNTPVPAEPPAEPDESAVVGFPKAIDAVATLPNARKRTPRDVLRGIVLRGVKSDGTVDITEKGSEVRYVFQSRPGEGPQPPRDPEGRPNRPYCGKQVVKVKAEGLQEDEDETKYSCSSKGFEPLPEPRCGPKEVWAHAVAASIPKDKPAQLEYYRAKAGPAWRFRIPGTRHRFSLYGDCERELKGLDEVGSVP
ncbi:MAG: hypothetical protein R3B07_15250 [Polyangiaceae bacterium]